MHEKCICESLELQNFPGEHAPGPPLGLKALRAFGKYTRLLLLSTHLCKLIETPAIKMST